MDKEKISVLIHAATGVGAGIISSLLANPMYNLAAALVILFGTGKVTEFVAEREDFKWWIGNGVVPYIFLWLISWVFLFNL